MKYLAAFVLFALVFVAGCTRYQYHASPISPPALAHNLQVRSLDDPDLLSWMKQAANDEPPSWPLTTWDLKSLTLAAYYFNPDLDVARANAATANAAIATARMKPNPATGVSAGYETSPESPFLMGINFSLPIETAGKRGFRIASAMHLSLASRLQVAETAWTVHSRVRVALTDYIFAVKTMELLRHQESLQNRYVDLLEIRFCVGEIPAPDVAAARIELTNLRQALRTIEGQIQTAHATLAAAIGIPDSALSDKNLSWPEADQTPAATALPSQGIREAALVNRLDVQRALEQYEAAQSNLQLEVARQHPDIDLGPGYAFEEGSHLISLSLSTILPVRNHNEGPIAEAEAQRRAAGAQLLAVQSAVIADTDKALAQYTASRATLEETRRSVTQLEEQRRTTYELLHSGEMDQLTALAADIQLAVAERAHLDALHQAQLSLGSLEDALQRPIYPITTPAFPQKAPDSRRTFQ